MVGIAVSNAHFCTRIVDARLRAEILHSAYIAIFHKNHPDNEKRDENNSKKSGLFCRSLKRRRSPAPRKG
jgi:hypothetical protein